MLLTVRLIVSVVDFKNSISPDKKHTVILHPSSSLEERILTSCATGKISNQNN